MQIDDEGKRGEREEGEERGAQMMNGGKKERTALFFSGTNSRIGELSSSFYYFPVLKSQKSRRGGERTRKLSPRKIYETAE